MNHQIQKSSNASSSFEEFDSDLNQALIGLLRRMVASEDMNLTPVYDLSSSTGYVYPEVADILGASGGAERLYLELLADRQYLLRDFFDKIMLCPTCRSCHLNLRETCQACHQANIQPVTLIHHYRCSYVAPEEEFLQGVAYICPKCQKQLNHIGVDYEKPGQRYRCESCKFLSSDTQTAGQCRMCQKNFLAEECPRLIVHSYRLGPLAREAARSGLLSAPSAAIEGEIDPQTGLYRPSHFRKRFKEETDRSRIYHRPMSLLRIHLPQAAKIRSKENAAQKILDTVVRLLRQTVTPLDIPTYLPESGVFCLLLESDAIRAAEVIANLQAAMALPENGSLSFEITHSTFPQDAVENGGWPKLVEALQL